MAHQIFCVIVAHSRKSPFRGQYGRNNPHNQAQSVSMNDGLSIDTLVEPIGYQQPELWAKLHLSFLLPLSSWITKNQTESVALSEWPTKAASSLASPQQHPKSQCDSQRHRNAMLLVNICHVPWCLIWKKWAQILNTAFLLFFQEPGWVLKPNQWLQSIIMMASLFEATSSAVTWVVWCNDLWGIGESHEIWDAVGNRHFD